MNASAPHTIARHCDVAVIGGSAAGLAAALQLVRQRRSVIVIDSGEPRNAPAAHMHGFLAHDGLEPAALTSTGRAEVRSYGGEILDGRVTRVSRTDDEHFSAELADGTSIIARRVLAATGLIDELPDIDGVAEHWGRQVIHCPFCHGYEVRDQRLVLILTHPAGLHSAALFAQLSNRLTVVLHEADQVDDAQLQQLRAGGVDIRVGPVRRIVTGADGHISGVELVDGTRLGADAVVVGPRFRARAEPFTELGLHAMPHPSGLGRVVPTDATGATPIPGLYAAGNITDPSHQVLHAAADGSRVGAMISFSLAAEDLQATARPSGTETDWDHRYSGEQLWSGDPNATLVTEIADLPPGHALDVGAGEGGDALWLAEHGWSVTASDISQQALNRISAEAHRRGLPVAVHHRDANALNAFEPAAFDLVTAHYASIPRSPDRRGVLNLLNAVAPCGTLLIVSHDLAPLRTSTDTPTHSRPFDPDAYQQADDFAAALAASTEWKIEIHEKRPRPAAAATAAHHIEDIVFRARRNAT